MSKPFYRIDYYNSVFKHNNSMEFDSLEEAEKQVKRMRRLFEVKNVKLYEVYEIKVD